jgi:hypothetical protein
MYDYAELPRKEFKPPKQRLSSFFLHFIRIVISDKLASSSTWDDVEEAKKPWGEIKSPNSLDGTVNNLKHTNEGRRRSTRAPQTNVRMKRNREMPQQGRQVKFRQNLGAGHFSSLPHAEEMCLDHRGGRGSYS